MYQEISKLLMYGDLPQDEILYKLGQLFELRITLLRVALTKPGSPLHQRDEQRKAGQN